MEEGKQTPIKKMEKIVLLVVILDRGKGDELTKTLRESGVTFNMIAPAYGAAGAHILDYLGLTSQERDMVFSVVTEDRLDAVLKKIQYKYDLEKPGKGVAFTIPITGVSGPLALRYISGIPENK